MNPALELARNLRAAERGRQRRLAPALIGYDSAATAEQRKRAAFRLVNALDTADRQYATERAEAFDIFDRRRGVAA